MAGHKEFTLEAGKSQKNVKTLSNPASTNINIENLNKSDDGRIRIISASFPMEEDFLDGGSKIVIRKKYNGTPIEVVNAGTTQLKIWID